MVLTKNVNSWRMLSFIRILFYMRIKTVVNLAVTL